MTVSREDDLTRISGDTSEDVTEVFVTQVAARLNETSSNKVPEESENLEAVVAKARQDGLLIRDRFVLLEQLGAGGMGTVFKAIDLRRAEADDPNSRVAIKFLSAAFSAHPDALVALQREARKTQQLAHPNIVTVYDFDRDDDRVFMTMELLDGEPLSRLEYLEQRSGKTFETADLVRQFAEGIAYAHSQGVIHCDLKPDNVFVTASGRVKVLDFGIARLSQQAEQSDRYDAGRLGALTRRFASLEMLVGGTEPHPADDVYAIGLIGWWLFTGQHAFGGAPADEAMAQALQPSGSSKSWRDRERKTLQRALKFAREDRLTDAGQFLSAFAGKTQRNRMLAGLALLLILVSGGWLYESVAPVEPEVPFASLPPETQQAFSAQLQRGYDHLEINDIDGALRYFDAAWLLHPWNADAVEAFDRLVDRVALLFADARSPEAAELLQPSLEAMRRNPYLEDQPDLNALFEEISGTPAGR